MLGWRKPSSVPGMAPDPSRSNDLRMAEKDVSSSRTAYNLAGRVALVTGSSRGIGAAIARAFARQGARVVVQGRDRDALARVRDEIVRAGGQAIDQVADVTRFEDIEAMRLA